MTEDDIEKFFLSLKGAELTYPFDDVTKVYKVEGKMFGLMNDLGEKLRVNLKGIPEDNIALREMFDFIEPGYHMNKTHWVSLYLDGTQEEDLIKRLIEESYNLIVSKLPKKTKEALKIRIK